jgi:hypothetical protein
MRDGRIWELNMTEGAARQWLREFLADGGAPGIFSVVKWNETEQWEVM